MSHISGSIENTGLKYKSLPTPETSDGLFKLHTLSAFIGPRGSGKTNAGKGLCPLQPPLLLRKTLTLFI